MSMIQTQSPFLSMQSVVNLLIVENFFVPTARENIYLGVRALPVIN